MRRARALVPLALVLAAAAPALATHGTVRLKDGRVFQDVDYEIKGNRITITFKNKSSTELSMNDVLEARPEASAEDGGGEGAEGAGAAPSAQDLAARCRLAPLEGWEPVATPSPLLRVLLKHAQRDATIGVYVRRAAGDLPADLTKQLPRDLTDDIIADFQARYARGQGSPKVSGGTLFDAPVLRIEGTATEFGSTTARKVTELRFRRFGLEYAVCYAVAPADEGALAHQVGAIFESFSFLPTVTATADAYADYGRGFAVARPNGDWQVLSAPFDEEAPVRLQSADGRAEVAVTVSGGTDADAAVRALFDKRKAGSRHFDAAPVEEAQVSGTAVRRFRFEDFNPGGKKKLLFKGFAAVVLGRVVLVTGVLPVSDEDSKKLEGEVDAVLAGARLFDVETLKAEVQKAQNALLLLKQGADAAAAKRFDEAIGKYDEALALAPSFARAFYLRGQAKKEKGDFPGSKEDLERAATLDPTAGYDAELISIYDKEAEAAERAKNWAEAVRLRQRGFRADRSEDRRRRLLQAAGSYWGDLKKDPARGLTTIDRELRGLVSDAGVADFLARTFRDGAGLLQRDSAWGPAKTWARRAKTVAPTAAGKTEADKLLDAISAAEQRARGGR